MNSQLPHLLTDRRIGSLTGAEDPDGEETCTGETTMGGVKMLGVNIEGVIWLGVNAGEYTRVGDSTGKGVGPCTGNLPAGWRLGICVSTVGISADPDIMVGISTERMVGMSSELIIGAVTGVGADVGPSTSVGAAVGVTPLVMAHSSASNSMHAVVGNNWLFGSTKARNSHSRPVVDKYSTELSAPKLLNENVSERSSAYTFTKAFPIALLLTKQHESITNTPVPTFSMITP